MTARLLFVGDIHLGRRPGSLPADLGRFALTPRDVSPVAAWLTTVDRAISLGVDAIVLAGDVVNGLRDRFEAYAPLRVGVEKLIRAGVAVYAVAGNHDVEALPRLARQIPEFKLLGAAGVWESVRVPTRAGTPVQLLGWSFPVERFRSNPIDSLRHDPKPGVATLGVLHCDVDASNSSYAPVAAASLRAVPVDAWLLGHIHKPDRLAGPTPIGYLGSLSGLDPGETGRRGPWLVEVDGPGQLRLTQLALAPIRYERVEIALDAGRPGDAREDGEDRVFASLSAALRGVGDRVTRDADADALRLVACRIGVSGAGRHEPGIRALLRDIERHPVEEREGVRYFVESIDESPRPDLDLESLAIGDDPPALLARRLLALQRGGPAADAIVERVRRKLEDSLSAPRWQILADAGIPSEPLDVTLLRAGVRHLEALLDQRRVATSGGRDSSR